MVYSMNNDELLDYVLEKDMEDTVSRIILNALKARGPMGRKKLCNLLRGKKPYQFRTPLKYPSEGVEIHWGRLGQLEEDQTLDFIESLTRLGLIEPKSFNGIATQLSVSPMGLKALENRDQIGAMIPWPFPAHTFPKHKRFGDTNENYQPDDIN